MSRNCALFSLLWLALVAPARAGDQAKNRGSLVLTITERASGGKMVAAPARVHLADARGQAVLAPGLPSFKDHFNCEGQVKLDLLPGTYTYTIERGPEFSRKSGRVEVAAGASQPLSVTLDRELTIDLAARGWYSGETHVHRPLADMPLLMRSEDLHVAPVLTVWNRTNLWKERTLPERLLVDVEPARIFHVLAYEDERRGGALLYFNLKRLLFFPEDGPEFPSPVMHLREALKQEGVWIDVEKPFWWDMLAWVATGKVRSVGLANNHMCRGEMKDMEAWGRPRDRKQFPSPRGNGFYSQDIYYRLLNCGLRIPPSAGSASGVLPNPVGYNRVYIHLDGRLTYDAWWAGLEKGRSFVTNGPILLVEANHEDPGRVFQVPAGEKLEIELKVLVGGNDPIEAVEVIRDGEVVARLDGKLLGPPPLPPRSLVFEPSGRVRIDRTTLSGNPSRPDPLVFERSGWFLVRAIAAVPNTFRFASTAAFYVEIGNHPRTVHRADVEYFLDWIDERIAALEADRERILHDPAQKSAVLVPHREARRFFDGLLRESE